MRERRPGPRSWPKWTMFQLLDSRALSPERPPWWLYESRATPRTIRCHPGIAMPAIGSRGVIPVMSVMSDWKRFRSGGISSMFMAIGIWPCAACCMGGSLPCPACGVCAGAGTGVGDTVAPCWCEEGWGAGVGVTAGAGAWCSCCASAEVEIRPPARSAANVSLLRPRTAIGHLESDAANPRPSRAGWFEETRVVGSENFGRVEARTQPPERGLDRKTAIKKASAPRE